MFPADRASDIASWKNELDAAVEADENEIEMMNVSLQI